MRRLSVAVIAAVSTIALTQIASAADLPVKAAPAPPPLPPPYNWTGFYVGVNAGWGWLNDDGNPYCINPAGVVDGTGCRTTNVPGGQVDGDGFIGGGQIGYNWQPYGTNWVVGIEADIQGADISGNVNIAGPFATVGGGPPGGNFFEASADLNWLGTVRGRAGWAFDRWLVYATGGFAYGGVDVYQNTVFPATQYPSSVNDTQTGWTVGGGVEWAFLGNWTGRIEGLYYDLGDVSTCGGSTPFVDNFLGCKNFELRGGIVRAALNYRF